MIKIRTLLIRWSYLLADLFLVSFAIQVFVIGDGGISIAYLPWLLAVTAVLLINTVLQGQAVPVNLAIACNILLSLAVGGLSFFCVPLSEGQWIRRVLIFFLAAVPAIHSPFLVNEEQEQSQLVLYLDVSVVATAIILLLDHVSVLPQAVPLAHLGELSCLALLLSLTSFRLQRPQTASPMGQKLTGTLILGGVLLLVLLAAALIASFFPGISTGLVGAAVWLGQQGLALLRAFGRGLAHFFTWLLSLFPSEEEAWIPPEPESTSLALEEAAVDSSDTLVVILFLFLAILAAAAILFAFRRLRGKRWQKKEVVPTARSVIRKTADRKWFSLLWQRLLHFLRFQYAYLRNRKTPAGLLVWTERQLHTTQLRRKKSESPPAYLRRLGHLVSLSESPASPPDFLTLANLLERQFYHRTEEHLPKGFYRQYKKSFAKAKL